MAGHKHSTCSEESGNPVVNNALHLASLLSVHIRVRLYIHQRLMIPIWKADVPVRATTPWYACYNIVWYASIVQFIPSLWAKVTLDENGTLLQLLWCCVLLQSLPMCCRSRLGLVLVFLQVFNFLTCSWIWSWAICWTIVEHTYCSRGSIHGHLICSYILTLTRCRH